MDANNFPYRPLGTDKPRMRLLHIRPGKFNHDIYCELEHACLDNRPNYTALSYVWGNPEATKPIMLRYSKATEASTSSETSSEDQDCRQMPVDDAISVLQISSTGTSQNQETPFEPFQVTTNLEEALRYLRDPTSVLTFWIDAVCINQGDLDERSAQVWKMGYFYAHAPEVRIWVGPAREASADHPGGSSVEESVRAVAHLVLRTKEASERLACPLDELPRHDPSFAVDESEARGLEFLANREWWKRLWVLQEAHFGPSPRIVQCSWTKIAFGDLAETIYAYMELKRAAGGMDFERLSLWALLTLHRGFGLYLGQTLGSQIEGSRLSPSQILGMLSRTSGPMLATDPRDKIFGLSTILGFHEIPELRPDYSKSASDVFSTVNRYLIEKTGMLHTLAEASGGDPSWVPNWTNFQLPNPLREDLRDLANFEFGPDPRCLRVRATILGSPRFRVLPRKFAWTTVQELRENWVRVERAIRRCAETIDAQNQRHEDTRSEEAPEPSTVMDCPPLHGPDKASRDFRQIMGIMRKTVTLDIDALDSAMNSFLGRPNQQLGDRTVTNADFDEAEENVIWIMKQLAVIFPIYFLLDSRCAVHIPRWQSDEVLGRFRKEDLIVAVPTCEVTLLLRRVEGQGERYRIVATLQSPGFTLAWDEEQRGVILGSEQRDIELV
jgi:hypothetical protein